MDSTNGARTTTSLDSPGSTLDRISSQNMFVTRDSVVTVEHPCIVRDTDEAIIAMGGEHRIKHIVQQLDVSSLPPLATALRPGDPFAKKLLSQKSDVMHVLLRVAIPRRTGRKRKRGSNDPFEYHDSVNDIPSFDDSAPSMPLKADEVLIKLKNKEYDIEPVGEIHSAHRFRGLSDFQVISQDSTIMQDIATSLLEPSLDKIKTFQPDMAVHALSNEVPGPPQLSTYSQQLYYGYAQNRSASQPVDGRVSSAEAVIPTRRAAQALPVDVASVPDGPPATLPALTSCSDEIRQCVSRLSSIMTDRPIITRRAALNLCPELSDDALKYSTQYCGYSFRSGPWRDTLVKYGVDPRTSSEYRKYQTMSFQVGSKDKSTADLRKDASGSTQWLRAYKVNKATERDENRTSHIFDGIAIGTNTRTWQMIDVTDPLLAPVIASSPARDDCDLENFGWYPNGLAALIRTIMKDKITMMVGDNDEDNIQWQLVYERVIRAIPSTINEGTLDRTYEVDMDGMSSRDKQKAIELMTATRSLAKHDDTFKHNKGRGGKRVSNASRFQNNVRDRSEEVGQADDKGDSGIEGVESINDGTNLDDMEDAQGEFDNDDDDDEAQDAQDDHHDREHEDTYD